MQALPEHGASLLPEIVQRYEGELRPLKTVDPRLDSSLTRECVNAFATIGIKLRPDMSTDQCGHWAVALIRGWSDLPHLCIRQALAEAVHRPFQFPSEVDAGVRELAEARHQRHLTALHRLKTMIAEIHRAAHPPQPQLTDETDRPMDLDEIRRCPKNLRRMGVKVGAISPEDLAIVEAEENGQPEAQG